MRGEYEDGGAASDTFQHDLVFALCHEVGNLLAASRLEAALLTGVSGSGELEAAAERFSEISARAGSLLALVRPLLAPSVGEAMATDPVEILGGLRRGLDASLDDRVIIDLESAAGLPAVAVDADTLHHLILNEIFFGLESGGSSDGLRVAARAEGDRVVLRVDGAGRPDPDPGVGPLRGRPLAHAIASALLSSRGGHLEVSQGDGRMRVDFALAVSAL